MNGLLKNIKSTTCTEYICSFSGSISIITNNIPVPSNLTIIEQHFKSIEGINNNNISASYFL